MPVVAQDPSGRADRTTVDTSGVLRVPALEIRQAADCLVYTFGIDGKQLHRIATVSRLRRDGTARLRGYQRPEALAHVAGIRRYLESLRPLLPNSIVIAFDDRVRFVPADPVPAGPEFVRVGALLIPVDDRLDEADRPGFIVDGQQRCAAVRDARVEAFPVPVNAFITGDVAEQRAQFILVNQTKPLPLGLIHELLPAATGVLPRAMAAKQLPATLLERLNLDPASSLRQRVRTPTNPAGVIKDTSMLKLLANSLSDGALYGLRGDGRPNLGAMFVLVSNFWQAVATVFPHAWDRTPRQSRLVHGAGVVALGFLMDAIAGDRAIPPDVDEFAAGLLLVRDQCRWTEGAWEFGGGVVRRWNDLQNTTTDIRLLTDFLLATYQARAEAR